METHEHLIPDDDLPGAGVIVPEFARQQLRESEEAGLIVWDDDHEHYHPSARGHLARTAAMILAKAASIDPKASVEEVTEAVVSCLPWAEGVTAISADDLPEGGIDAMLASHGIAPFVVGSDGDVLSPFDQDKIEGAFDDVMPDDIINGGSPS